MLSYGEMKTITDEVSHTLQGAAFCSMRKIGKFRWLYTFKERDDALLICTHFPFSRFHLALKEKGETTEWTKNVENFLTGEKLRSIELARGDRVLSLHLSSEKTVLIEFFSKGGNSYLLQGDQIVGSLFPTDKEQYTFPTCSVTQNEYPTELTSREIAKRYEDLEKQALFEERKKHLAVQIALFQKKAERLLERKLAEEQEKGVKEQHLAELLKANLYRFTKGMEQISVEDWSTGEKQTVDLDPKLSAKEQLEVFFHRAKKAKKRALSAGEIAQRTRQHLIFLQKALAKLEEIENEGELEKLRRSLGLKTKKEREEKKGSVFRQFVSRCGEEILVGKNARANDKLTFSIARGSDYWFHVSGAAGSHVVLRVQKNKTPDPLSIEDAMQLALEFSKAKEEAEVIISRVKHLKKGRKPGEVFVSEHQKRRCKREAGVVKRLLSTPQLHP